MKKIFLILFLLTLILFSLHSSANAQNITLTIKSEPSGANVFIDRELKGTTPYTIKLEKGEHLIRVAVDAYWRPYIEKKNITEDTTLNVKLMPINELSYDRGLKSFQSGSYKSARSHFEKAVSGKGRVIPEAYFYLAIIDRMESKDTSAKHNLKKFINLNPQKGQFMETYPEIYKDTLNYSVKISHFLLGEIYRKNYEWANAATAYKLAIPDYKRFIDEKSKPSYEQIRKLREKVNKNPDNYGAQIQLGYLFELKGKLFQAMMSYRDAAKKIYAKSPEFMKKYGKLLESE
ncbi:MAG: PEGA domain-containing protein [Candidatus Eremiobacteraeota bacterium]|nr:PEGA domain-containing protein [Candidatus Eremiobacteraeota bacterium]